LPSRALPRILTGLAVAVPVAALTLAPAAAASADPVPSPTATPPAAVRPAPLPAHAPAAVRPAPATAPKAAADTDLKITIDLPTEINPGHKTLLVGRVAGLVPGRAASVEFTYPSRLAPVPILSVFNSEKGSVSVTQHESGNVHKTDVAFKTEAGRDWAVVYMPAMPSDGPKLTGPVSVSVASPDAPDADPSNDISKDELTIESAGSVTGHVWEDVNRDSVRQWGDKGLPGAQVSVFPQGKTTAVAAPVVVGKSGEYAFPHLPDGQYRVEVTPPAGAWTFVTPNRGSDTVDSDVMPVSGSHTAAAVVAVKGERVVVDAGLARTLGPAQPGPAPSSPAPSPSPAAGSLPVTGASVGGALAAGATALVLGIGAVVLARRRRTA
jgi:LPXTG-motif cell wall-anchored protein